LEREGISAITQMDAKSPVAEAYRLLRSNIQFASIDRELRTLLITSASPEEGKSTTLFNLGVVMAQSGKKVILLGCDLRKPTLHRLCGGHNRVGVTTVLLGQKTVDEALQKTGVPNLLLLNSGPVPPNPSELLGSAGMRTLLEQLKERADIVLVDSPPVLPVADAVVLSAIVDGVLLVVSAGHTQYQVAKDAKAALDNAKANIIGAVLNNVPVTKGNYYYYYYYYSSDSGEESSR